MATSQVTNMGTREITRQFSPQGTNHRPKASTGQTAYTGKLAETQHQTANHTEESEDTKTFISRENYHALLSTALVTAMGENGQPQILRCLIDTGSQSSFLTKAACKKLGAPCLPISTKITGLSTSPAGVAHQQTTLHLQSCESDGPRITEDFLVVKGITDPLPTEVISNIDHRHLSNLQLADPGFWKPGKIDALLGARVYAQIVLEGIKRGSKASPVAINTMFGWILLGSTQKTHDQVVALSVSTTDTELSDKVQKFWEIEEMPPKHILTPKEEECQGHFEANYQRLDDGRYEVKLPFINNENPSLGESRPQAIKRFWSLQRQFKNRPDLEREYSKCLDEYIELGHMTEVHPPRHGEDNYYIPHHAVFKDSATTKLRVVFDASARTSNGKSLNEQLLKGPTIQSKLFNTLLNWRKHKIAIHADIEKMYRMIRVHESHRTFQRIIWRDPKTMNQRDYQLNTVTFGTTSAPYLAIRTLQQLAMDERERWPKASKATLADFYVDDILTGAHTIADAKQLQHELMNMLSAGGFNLRKWSSNELKLVENLPEEQRELKGALTIAEDEIIKTLGIKWHPASDNFTFTINSKGVHKFTTKRTILSDIASLYDPLGWLAPLIIVAKLLMQTLWIIGSSWDAPVSTAIENHWKAFQSDLQNLQHLKIPRWIRYSPNARLQLHGFCDASARAYAAVLYLRVQNENGEVSVNLLTSKTKVAPVKPVTIPRLELNAAVILARLTRATIESMDFQTIPIMSWTDSMITLQWIREHPSRWKTYVANRVVEIQETVRYDRWRHVPTNQNPADLACRGTSLTNLADNNLWWHGPNWLTKCEAEWPRHAEINETTSLEAKQSRTTTLNVNIQDNILDKYSSFTRLNRIVALLQRFAHNTTKAHGKVTGHLTYAELQRAETVILKLVQQTTFPEDYENLLQKRPLTKRSRLLKLNPFLDADGVIRLGGRLDQASISYSQKHPIILPQDHHVTSTLIDKLHKETLHGGPSVVLSTSRNKYWILNAKRAITTRLHRCVICARYKREARTQLMGNLPSCRVNVTRPFTKVGIDYAGPITLKTSNLRNAKLQKAYFCIFVCMVTKAIHIELVSDLTTDAFLAALRRFIARRGLCADIYSDCGTNFVGAKGMLDKQLQHAIKNAESEAAQNLATKAITWHFNPPAAPHFGGIWEAGVKSIKYHLRRVLGNSRCTFEEYATILAQIEACLNSRPLCQVSNDPEELLILTPGHFLIGQPLTAIPEPDQSCAATLAQRWKHVQNVTRQFWDKWSKDYLNTLQHRPKWHAKQRNIRTGDIVLIRNENMTPTYWPLGKIEKTYPGADGLVRVVDVRTQTGLFKRPVSKICPLPIEDDN